MDFTTHETHPRCSELPPGASLGAYGEQLAASHLVEDGLEVVARNWRLTAGELRGELDVVALDHDRGSVVVVEVKTRRGDGYGGPLLAVIRSKQVKIRRLAVAFLIEARLPYRTVRFDVIALWLPRGGAATLRHVEAAF